MNCTLRIGRHRLGFSHDLIRHHGEPYLERWILWFGPTLRVHRFFSSDEDRAVHDHPWWFVTLPLHGYREQGEDDPPGAYRRVSPWRLHARSASFRHRVRLDRFPTWTLVLTGPKVKEWGFWEQGNFVHHQDWLR